MDGGDRRLELVRPDAPLAERALHELLSLRDPGGVPAAAILVLEPHERAVRALAGRPAGVRQQHQREQADRLGLVGQQLRDDPRQPDRLGAQLAPDQRLTRRRVVALVEHEVEHAQHGLEPVGQPVADGTSYADARLADLLLRPDEPLGERGLGDEEGAGDLGRRQAAEGAQGQRDRRLRRERRVAAGEDQSQLVVGDR